MNATLHFQLSRKACLDRLAGQRIGRLALSVNALPVIEPARYVLRDEELFIGGLAKASFGDALANSIVAFEVDSIDRSNGLRWVVCVVGQATPVLDRTTIGTLRALPTGTWDAAETERFFRIATTSLTGRSVDLQHARG